MTGLLRSVRSCVVALLTLGLVLGTSGFAGAIHSVHHLPASTSAHDHDARGDGHDEQHPTPRGGSQETCPVAAAALHLAATPVEALPAPELSPADAGLLALGPERAPCAATRAPSRGRAPPVAGSRPS